MMAAEEPAMFYPTPGQDLTQGLQRACMERVFAQDAQAASADPAQQTYRMRQIDTANRPADFRGAYFDHTTAWEEFARIRQAQGEPNSEGSQNATIGASVIATLLDIDAPPIADNIDAELRLQRASEEAAREIDESFRNLERIALSYGVSKGFSFLKNPFILEATPERPFGSDLRPPEVAMCSWGREYIKLDIETDRRCDCLRSILPIPAILEPYQRDPPQDDNKITLAARPEPRKSACSWLECFIVPR